MGLLLALSRVYRHGTQARLVRGGWEGEVAPRDERGGQRASRWSCQMGVRRFVEISGPNQQAPATWVGDARADPKTFIGRFTVALAAPTSQKNRTPAVFVLRACFPPLLRVCPALCARPRGPRASQGGRLRPNPRRRPHLILFRRFGRMSSRGLRLRGNSAGLGFGFRSGIDVDAQCQQAPRVDALVRCGRVG